MSNTWFLTGALGCIGAWVTKTVLDRGDRAVVFDLGGDARRLRDLMDEEALARVDFVQGDITEQQVDAIVKTIVELSAQVNSMHDVIARMRKASTESATETENL